MPDDKSGRDKQADDADRRQRERDVTAELERGDEPEPPVYERELGDFEAELAEVSFPATGAEVVAAAGHRQIESSEGTYAVADLVPDTESETYEELPEVRQRVQRPTIAAAMKRIVEASESVDGDLRGSQREAYEKTLRELKAIDADDDDEGVRAITDWIVGRIDEKGKLPDSRGVRREAAKFCRSNGYEVRSDEWLGI